MNDQSGLKSLGGQLRHPQLLLAVGHRKSILWGLETVSNIDEHGEDLALDAGKHPSALCALAFSILRLAFVTMIKQATARLYR